ncbi:MAG: NUDIX domain-containing protein [Patescibacteria group bacterium]
MEDKSYGIIPIMIKDKTPFFLIVQLGAGHWAFSKGHLEHGETEISAAKRELLEETGIKKCKVIASRSFIENFSYKREGEIINKEVKYFLGIVKNPSVTIDQNEIRNYVWLPYYSALRRITFPQAKKVLSDAYNFFKQNKEKILGKDE